MKLSGTQYYWVVAIGMLFGIVLSIPIAIYEQEINSNPILVMILAALSIIPTICYCTVLLEIWSRFRFKSVLVVGGALVLSAVLHPIFLALVIIWPIIYWFIRINGISNVVKHT